MDDVTLNLTSLVNSCKPNKKRGRPSHKRQLQEIRDEKKINLQTSDSILTITNLKSILTLDALKTLSQDCQLTLIKLLPKLDQILNQEDQKLMARESALSNEYFAEFCTQYQEKLSDNRLSEDALEQAKSEESKELAKIDPWKLKNFEPTWGKKLPSRTL